ncbi:MAG: WYL domain-containing protein [Archangium sp.]|nr:WYL domain-containing protein [Archangium sp.]
MERTERLLDLVALLLAAPGPLAWEHIFDAFPDDYGGAPEAAERKFERDKAELLELGVPITFVTDDDGVPGYVIDRAAYYLPDAGFTPDELAVLYAAGSAALASGAFPGRHDLAHALRKIGFLADGPLPTPKVRFELDAVADADALATRLEMLWRAVGAAKWVDLDYFSPRGGAVTQRRVNPYGLALRRGVWSLVGWCHLRQGIRTFHVHRIRALRPNPAKPKTPDFTVPPDFDVDAYVARWPWQHHIHPPMAVELEVRGGLAARAAHVFPPGAVEGRTVRLAVTHVEGLVRFVLPLGAEVSVVQPPEAVERLQQAARRIALAHGGAA